MKRNIVSGAYAEEFAEFIANSCANSGAVAEFTLTGSECRASRHLVDESQSVGQCRPLACAMHAEV